MRGQLQFVRIITGPLIPKPLGAKIEKKVYECNMKKNIASQLGFLASALVAAARLFEGTCLIPAAQVVL